MLLFELDFEEVSKKKLRECWSQLCRIRCTVALYSDGSKIYTNGNQQSRGVENNDRFWGLKSLLVMNIDTCFRYIHGFKTSRPTTERPKPPSSKPLQDRASRTKGEFDCKVEISMAGHGDN